MSGEPEIDVRLFYVRAKRLLDKWQVSESKPRNWRKKQEKKKTDEIFFFFFFFSHLVRKKKSYANAGEDNDIHFGGATSLLFAGGTRDEERPYSKLTAMQVRCEFDQFRQLFISILALVAQLRSAGNCVAVYSRLGARRVIRSAHFGVEKENRFVVGAVEQARRRGRRGASTSCCYERVKKGDNRADRASTMLARVRRRVRHAAERADGRARRRLVPEAEFRARARRARHGAHRRDCRRRRARRSPSRTPASSSLIEAACRRHRASCSRSCSSDADGGRARGVGEQRTPTHADVTRLGRAGVLRRHREAREAQAARGREPSLADRLVLRADT
jgi:hypothetical protein